VKLIERPRRVKVSADGKGVVSHAGTGMLRELAHDTGLVAGVTGGLADTYAGPWVHAPGRVFAEPYSKLHLSEKKNKARAASNASRYVA
jgi:hypothetical protein